VTVTVLIFGLLVAALVLVVVQLVQDQREPLAWGPVAAWRSISGGSSGKPYSVRPYRPPFSNGQKN
jgi:hypothetical protein